MIHRADLEPLDNLELFGMSPLYSLASYRARGRNAAGYALGQRVGPVPTELDNFARAKLIVRTTLLHARETQAVELGAEPSNSSSRACASRLNPGHVANGGSWRSHERPMTYLAAPHSPVPRRVRPQQSRSEHWRRNVLVGTDAQEG